MEYEVQSARITTSGKLPDRFLNCQSKTTTDLAKTYMGTIHVLVEIMSPWFSTAQIGQTIINAFTQNYYLGGSTSDLANFEEALKKVNEALAEATQNGETNWIGNLNAILAVVIENKIHIAQTGKAEAYIFREGKINHLTYGLSQGQVDTHPLKTFSNITSGELKSRDKVLLANPDLLNQIELETLREIITLHHPNEAILLIAKILKKKKIKGVNCLILDLLSLEEASRQPVNNLSDNIHLDKPIESFWIVVEKFWQQFVKPAFKFTESNAKKVGTHSWKFTKTYLEKMQTRKENELPKKKDLFDKEFMTEENLDEGLLKDEEIKYSPELNIHHYEKELSTKHNRWKTFENIFNKILTIIIKFLTWVWDKYKNKKTRPYVFGAIAIIIITIVGLSIFGGRNGNTKKLSLLEAQNILREAEAAQKEAKMALLSTDQSKAIELFAECTVKSEQIITKEVVKSTAKEVNSECQNELDKLTSTTRHASLKPVMSVSADTKALFVVSGQVFFMTKDSIYRGSTNGGEVQKVSSLPKNNGDFQFGTVEGNTIFFYTSAQKVYEYNLEKNKLELSPINGTWETANAATYYGGNLYLLDGILGQIYRHTSGQDSFGQGESYISSAGTNVKNSVSFAIDGSVYVLAQSGEVLELQKGKVQDFSIQDTPAPDQKIEKPIKIYTDTDTTSIYILDGAKKRILEYDKNGVFVHQYALPSSFDNLTDFTVSVKAKTIWVLDNNNLYEIKI